MTKFADAGAADRDDMDDPLLGRLRAARPEVPDEVVSPDPVADRALVEAIIAGRPVSAVLPRTPRWRRAVRRHRRRVAAVAAVAAAAAGAVVLAPFGSPEPTSAAVVRAAAVASEEALGTGRAVLTVETETTDSLPGADTDGPHEPAGPDVYEYTFAGDDVAVEITFAGMAAPGGVATGGVTGARRIVDGELYWHVGDDPATPWFHLTDVTGPDLPATDDFEADPRVLLAGLAPTAAFEAVGDDSVDDVPVTHLRATTPGDVGAASLGLGTAAANLGPDGAAAVTALDVWIDRDDVVRRIDVEVTSSFEHYYAEFEGPMELVETTQVTTASVRFRDIGVPNTVEAPAHVEDVDVTDMANPPPPT